MGYNLFLDDERMPYQVGNYIYPVEIKPLYRLETWEIVRNYEEFVKIIEERGLPSLISFDHDLADIHYDSNIFKETFTYREKTGYDCAKWLIDYCQLHNLELPKYLVHSMNPIGKENIQKLLENFKKTLENENI